MNSNWCWFLVGGKKKKRWNCNKQTQPTVMLNMAIAYSHQNTKPGYLWTLISAKVRTVLWL